MYKVIFSDLDGTLLNDDKSISKRNLEAIAKAKEKGAKFVVCTGRLPFCYKMFKDILDLSDAVSTNGAILYSNGEKIKAKYLDKDIANKVLDYAISHNEYQRIFGEDYLYLLHIEKGGSDAYFYKDSKGVSEKEAVELVNTIDIVKFGFFGEREHLNKIRKDIDDMNLGVDTVFSGARLLEVLVKGENKGQGIIDYCKYNNISIEETIGVGDEENDMPMLKTVGLACCPSNASKTVKEMCDYITNANNNEGAIAEIIEKYILEEWLLLLTIVVTNSENLRVYKWKRYKIWRIRKIS